MVIESVYMKLPDQDFLFDLLSTPSPTGFEMPGQRVWADYLKPYADSIECDAYGSTWATLKGKSDKVVMLESHADEIGYIIKQITDSGFLRLDRIGGSDTATARGRRLRILGTKGDVTGIIGNTAIHLRKDSLGNEKSPKIHELWVDVGASSKREAEELGLRVGLPAIYEDGPFELNGKLVARAVDNRIGGYICAQVMKNLAASGETPEFTVVCLNAVQEEIGGHGAQMATHRLMPEVALCLDVTHATDTPGISHAIHGDVKLGGGPTVTHGTCNHPLVVERLIQNAEEQGIPLQHESSSRYSGTDTDSIFVTREGVPSGLVSLPLRCMHSVVEMADPTDIEQTIALMTEFVRSLQPDDTFCHQL